MCRGGLSVTAILSNPAVTGLIGVVAGGALTGWFGIRVKKRQRVQQRRAEVYVDMLTWIGTRMPKPWQVRLEAATSSAKETKSAPDQGAMRGRSHSPDIAVNFPDTKPRTTFPDPEAVDANNDKTGLCTPFFVTLRARVAAFGSHDMARAFDRWAEAYRIVLAGSGTKCPNHPTPDFDDPKLHYRKYQKPDCKNSAQQRLNPISVEKPDRSWHQTLVYWRTDIRFWHRLCFLLKHRVDSSLPDGKPGCLTDAIEQCASKELRKG
jgi:type II secretory pathway pseudopilin PulG